MRKNPVFVEAFDARTHLSATPAQATAPSGGSAIIVTPSVKLAGKTIAAEATDTFQSVIGTISNFKGSLATLQASVTWGDGTPVGKAYFVGRADGKVDVIAAHTYAKAGNFNLSINVTQRPVPVPGGATAQYIIELGTIHSKAVVTPDLDGGVQLTEVATQKFSAKIGSFDFHNVDLLLTAKVSWGDGTTSNGLVVSKNTNGEYDVVGTHTYAKTGKYKVQITLFGQPIGGPTGIAIDPFLSIQSLIDVKGFA